MDDKTKLLASELARLAPGEAVVWSDDHATLVPGVRTSWVDVRLDGICDRLGWSWALTIAGPDLDDEPSELSITLDYDRVVHAVWDPDTYWFLPDAAIALPVGAEPDAAQLEALARVVDAGEGRTLSTRPGFTITAINAALAAWTARWAQRSDLQFGYDPELVSPLVAHLVAVADALERGEVDTFEIAPGVRAPGEVLDQLLEMGPDGAAELTAKVIDALDELTG